MESAFKSKIADQLDRLLSQLQDLETYKDDPDITKEDFEYVFFSDLTLYRELKQDTEAQLKEFESFLSSAN